VAPGDQFEAAGFRVRAVGGRHATVFGGEPDLPNTGYVIEDGALYHPGDAFAAPEVDVAVLLVPVQGSWMRLGDAMDFVTRIQPERAIGIHDGQLNDRGLAAVNGWLSSLPGYRYLSPGQSLG